MIRFVTQTVTARRRPGVMMFAREDSVHLRKSYGG